MKAAIEVLFQRRSKSREEMERDIDEELRFHVELLTHEHQRQQMAPGQAEQAALKRFGDIQQIKDECLAISRRRRPALVALKSFLLVVFLSGIVVRILSTALNTRRMGDLLIAIPILTGVLLYVRGLHPARFVSEPGTATPLRLNEVQPLFTPYDDGMLTPVERLISDK